MFFLFALEELQMATSPSLLSGAFRVKNWSTFFLTPLQLAFFGINYYDLTYGSIFWPFLFWPPWTPGRRLQGKAVGGGRWDVEN